MKIDRKTFFEHFRTRFQERLGQGQVNGYDAIFDYWESSTLHDKRWLAYALATAYHETGTTMQAVREGFCDTDACSVKTVTRLFERGKIQRNYALPHPNGKSYFCRGLVQIPTATTTSVLAQRWAWAESSMTTPPWHWIYTSP